MIRWTLGGSWSAVIVLFPDDGTSFAEILFAVVVSEEREERLGGHASISAAANISADAVTRRSDEV